MLIFNFKDMIMEDGHNSFDITIDPVDGYRVLVIDSEDKPNNWLETHPFKGRELVTKKTVDKFKKHFLDAMNDQ